MTSRSKWKKIGIPLSSDSRRMILLLLFLTVLIAFIGRLTTSVALEEIGGDLVWSEAEQGYLGGLLMGIFLISYGFSNVFLSPNIDRYGSKAVLTVSMIGCSFSVFLGAFFGNIYWLFLLSRLLLGLTQGVMFPVASKVIGGWYREEKRGRANSIFMIGGPIGVAAAPIIMGPVIHAVSWEASFYLVAAFGFILSIPILLFIDDTPADLEEQEEKELGSKNSIRSLLKKPEVTLIIVGFTATTTVWWGTSLWIPKYLAQVHGVAIAEMAYVAAVPYAGAILGLYTGAWLSDRTGRTDLVIMFSLFMAGVLIAALTFFPIPGLKTAVSLLFLVFLFGQLAPPLFFAKIQNTVSATELGSATGLMNGTANFIGICGPLAVGGVLALTGSYDYGLLTLSAISFAGLAGFYGTLKRSA
ncbi:MAG: MFS transporter [Candidatus Natronoplasma sp.]